MPVCFPVCFPPAPPASVGGIASKAPVWTCPAPHKLENMQKPEIFEVCVAWNPEAKVVDHDVHGNHSTGAKYTGAARFITVSLVLQLCTALAQLWHYFVLHHQTAICDT